MQPAIVWRQSFEFPDDLLRHLEENAEISAVLLVERAIKQVTPDRMEVLTLIRTADPTLRILFIADTPERDYEFELWCHAHGVYDIAYPSRQTEVDIDAICEKILLGRIDPENRVSHHDRDGQGGVVKTHGQHVRVGAISERLAEQLSLCGVDMGQLEGLMREPQSVSHIR